MYTCWMLPIRAITDEACHLCSCGSDYGIGDSPFDEFYWMVADELGWSPYSGVRCNNKVERLKVYEEDSCHPS